VCGAMHDKTIIKEPYHQIFVDIAQEGVNHGKSCVVWNDYCLYICC
jgi:hypothetical protein